MAISGPGKTRRAILEPSPGNPAPPRDPPAGSDLGPCPLCGRPMIAGPSVDRHHWRPRRQGGRAWSWLHVVCHRKIHAELSEATLAATHHTPEALKADPAIAAFLKWVAGKPPEFVDHHRRPGPRRRGRG